VTGTRMRSEGGRGSGGRSAVQTRKEVVSVAPRGAHGR
jgi:hypothetical protein